MSNSNSARGGRNWIEINRGVIAQYREHGRVLTGPYAGKENLLLLTTTGARTGSERTSPLYYTRDGANYILIASKGGAPSDPDWYRNLRAHPEATIQVGMTTLRVRSSVAQGAERQRLFDQMAAHMPFYADYQRGTARQIPVIVLEPVEPREG